MAAPAQSGENAVIATVTEGVDIGLYGIKAYDNGNHLCTRWTRSEFLAHPRKAKWFMYNWQIARFFRFLAENGLSLRNVHKQSNETLATLVRYLVNDAILDGDALVEWIAEVTEWSKSRAEQYVRDPTKINTTRYPDPAELQKRRASTASISPTAVRTPALIVTPKQATYPSLAAQLQGRALDDDEDEGVDTTENDAAAVVEDQDSAAAATPTFLERMFAADHRATPSEPNAPSSSQRSTGQPRPAHPARSISSALPEDKDDAAATTPTFLERMFATDHRATLSEANAPSSSQRSTGQPRPAHPARSISPALPDLEDHNHDKENAVQLHARIVSAQQSSNNMLEERMATLALSDRPQPSHPLDLSSSWKVAPADAPPSPVVHLTGVADSRSDVTVAGPSKREGKGKEKQVKFEEHDEAEQEVVYKPTTRATTPAAQQTVQRPSPMPTPPSSHLHSGIPTSSMPRLQQTWVSPSPPKLLQPLPDLGNQGQRNMYSQSMMGHASPALGSAPAVSFPSYGLPPPLPPVSMPASHQGRPYASLSPPAMPWMQQQQSSARQHLSSPPQLAFGTPLSFPTGLQAPLAQVRAQRQQQQIGIGQVGQQGWRGPAGSFIQAPAQQWQWQQQRDGQ